MNTRLLLLLMVLSCLSLAGLGFSGILVSRAQKHRQKRDARLAMVVAPHARAQRLDVSAFIRAPQQQDQSTLGTAASVFGFDANNLHRYPLTWWLVVLVTLMLGFAAHSLLADLLGMLSWVAVPVVCIALSRGFFGWFDGRQRALLLAQFPDALAMIVRSVRVGIPVQDSIRTVARESPHPTGPEFARLVDDVSVGVSMEDAIIDLARRTGLQEYRFFATTISLQNQTGGALSETLDNLADVIRKRAALKGKAKAMTSEAKTSAIVLAALPFVTAAMLWLMNPQYIGMLVTDSTGNKMLAGAVASLMTGLFIIRTIIRRSLPL